MISFVQKYIIVGAILRRCLIFATTFSLLHEMKELTILFKKVFVLFINLKSLHWINSICVTKSNSFLLFHHSKFIKHNLSRWNCQDNWWLAAKLLMPDGCRPILNCSVLLSPIWLSVNCCWCVTPQLFVLFGFVACQLETINVTNHVRWKHNYSAVYHRHDRQKWQQTTHLYQIKM